MARWYHVAGGVLGATVMALILWLLLRSKDAEGAGAEGPGGIDPLETEATYGTMNIPACWNTAAWGPFKVRGLTIAQATCLRTMPNYADPPTNLYTDRGIYYRVLWLEWTLLPPVARAIVIAHASYAGGRPFPPKNMTIKAYNNLGMHMSQTHLLAGRVFHLRRYGNGTYTAFRSFDGYPLHLSGYKENVEKRNVWAWLMGLKGSDADLHTQDWSYLCTMYVKQMKHWFGWADKARLNDLGRDLAWIVRNKVVPLVTGPWEF